jgi:flagellar capping protein FliD
MVSGINTNIISMYSGLFSLGSVSRSGGAQNGSQYVQSLYKSNSEGRTNAASWQSLRDLKNSSYQLISSVGQLKAARSQKTATSSDQAALSINNKTKTSSLFKNATIKIDSIATKQTNSGTALAADGSDFTTGTQKFEIKNDSGKSQVFSVDVNAGDTNKAVQQKMASAINSSNLGVTAQVAEDEEGNSSLVLTAKETGTKNSFTVRDTEGDLAATSGATNASQAATDAVYQVDGGFKRTSSSNDVYLNHGVSATLQQASQTPVKVTQAIDGAGAAKQIEKFVDDFNDFATAATKTGNSALKRDLNSALSDYASSLAKIGITQTTEGKMSLDTEKLDAAAQNGELQSFVSGNSSSALTSRLANIAANANSNPASYQGSLYNNYATVYNRMPNTGLIFDLFA